MESQGTGTLQAAAALPSAPTIQDEVRDRLGVLPNFFRLAPDTPEITANLWGFAKFAYLDNPLPSLFKERLFVYLSRFCDVRYCIARHVGFLIGLGRPSGDAHVVPQRIDDVVRLLKSPLPDGDELDATINLCATCAAPLLELPPPDSAMESALIACSSHVFLQTSRAPAAAEALRRVLGETAWQHLTAFLAFVRTAHYWTKVHTELQFEDDLLQLTTAHERLADCLFNDPEAQRSDVGRRVAEELEDLRAAQRRHEADRQRSGEKLRESEERFRAAFESSVVGFAILQLDTTFLQLNDAFCRISGYSRDELKTMRYASLTHPDDREQTDAMVADVVSGRRPAFVLEQRYHRKGGAQIWVQNSVSATRDTSGHAQHLVVVCQDVTERRRASQMKDEFLATLSHELRTPLNAVVGWAQVLRTGVLTKDMVEKALEAIERNARAQATLVDELLDLSRIVAGKLEVGQDVVDLSLPIANAVESIRPAAATKRLSVNVRVEPNAECYVRGDSDRLQQVVLNLLSNAVKFTPQGGTIDVALACGDGDALIRVQDNGQGIRAELQPFIFERFRQGDGTSTRRHGGLGLGLAIVRHLTEAHRGTVGVESGGEGCGTTFTIRLPLAEVPLKLRTVTTIRPPRRSRSLPGTRVLVVDDMADARDLMRVALESAGAQVATASTAPEALAMLVGDRFDLLLVDIGMPGQDGYAFIEALRHDSSRPGAQIPAVAVSAYAGLADRQRALTAGFDDHIGKPVDPATLIDAVAAVLAVRRA